MTVLVLSILVSAMTNGRVRAGANCEGGNPQLDSEEAEMLPLLKKSFQSVADGAQLDARLQQAAAWFARDVAVNLGGFVDHEHTDSLGDSFSERFVRCGLTGIFGTGEAIAGEESRYDALNYFSQYASALVGPPPNTWNAVGVARYQASNGNWYWVVAVAKVSSVVPYVDATPTSTPPQATATATPTLSPTASATASASATVTPTSPPPTETATPSATETTPPAASSTPTEPPTPSATGTAPPLPTPTTPPVGIGQGWQLRSDLPDGPLPAVLERIGGCDVAAIYAAGPQWQRWLRDAPAWTASLDALLNGDDYWLRGECGQ